MREHFHELGNMSVPRTRGDGPLAVFGELLLVDCSPHARGWTVLATADRPVPRTRGDGPQIPHRPARAVALFPALAGMDQ